MNIERECPMCGQVHTMTLTKDEGLKFEDWENNGLLIQEAFPGFNPMEREFIKTGYCKKCQEMLFMSEYESERISD